VPERWHPVAAIGGLDRMMCRQLGGQLDPAAASAPTRIGAPGSSVHAGRSVGTILQ
jgi:hypothetical protein